MKNRTLLHVVIGLAATICFVAAGLLINLGQNYGDTSAARLQSQVVRPHPAATEIFNFGDDNNHQILLELANSPMQDYTLQPVSLDDPLTAPQIAVCTHTGVPVASPPAGVTAQTASPAEPPAWERILAWLTTSTSDSYFISLWSPNANADAYVLVSGDGPTAPVVCASLPGKDV